MRIALKRGGARAGPLTPAQQKASRDIRGFLFAR
ncbi:hypothetical protein ACFDR9_005262 [Janthinobacterium sp. CG_23.3]|nr:hypothetical protein [Janthinobacterium sp. CG_S6]